ncbi:MAG: TIGR01620 family protein [Paracoccaceae bacterium]|nr:MAG: TIGR01620 family protein [Paracoccaceae bacterium]
MSAPPSPPRPVLIELDAPGPSPADAPPVEGPMPLPGAMRGAAAVAAARPSRFGRLAIWVLGAFGSFVISVALWDFVTALLARNSLLGSVAMLLTGAAVLVVLVFALREAMAYARLARIDDLHRRIVAARTAPLAEARRAAAAVEALYAGREDMRWALDRLRSRRDEVLDADAVIALTEAELMAALDLAARAEIEGAARQVALATALVPLALADVAVALWANLRMVRRLAAIYGGRAGTLGSWRLMRRVFTHLAATGALALTDDLIGSVAGGGVLSKLSRRFGEGLVNGALTARVGVAAMEVCRPMPFAALPRPKVSNLVGRALSGLIPSSDRGD